MGPERLDTAVVEHVHRVRARHGRHPVGDHERRAPLPQTGGGGGDLALQLGIEIRGRLVEDEEPGLSQEGPCEDQSLPLPSGQTGSPVPHGGVESSQILDEPVQTGGAQTGPHALLIRLPRRQAQVGAEGPREDVPVLGNEGDVPPVLVRIECPEILAREAHASLVGVHEAHDDTSPMILIIPAREETGRVAGQQSTTATGRRWAG